MMRVSRMNKSRRLFHIDFFREVAIKESIFDIRLMYKPFLEIAMLRTVQIVAGLTTGLKVSSKSRPGS